MNKNLPQDGGLPLIPVVGTNFVALIGALCILLHFA